MEVQDLLLLLLLAPVKHREVFSIMDRVAINSYQTLMGKSHLIKSKDQKEEYFT